VREFAEKYLLDWERDEGEMPVSFITLLARVLAHRESDGKE
jgi:hypothetical protein